MSGWPSLPCRNSGHLAAQVGMSCGLPIFTSCMPPRSHFQEHGVLEKSLGVSFWPVPCVGPRSCIPLSCSSCVQSMWIFHQFCVGSSDINFPYSIWGELPCLIHVESFLGFVYCQENTALLYLWAQCCFNALLRWNLGGADFGGLHSLPLVSHETLMGFF